LIGERRDEVEAMFDDGNDDFLAQGVRDVEDFFNCWERPAFEGCDHWQRYIAEKYVQLQQIAFRYRNACSFESVLTPTGSPGTQASSRQRW